jgi:WD40 repeat protein
MQVTEENGFICQFENCKLLIENPIILPCGFSICQEHLVSFNETFKCIFCEQEHIIPEYGFTLNRNLVAIMKNHSHLSKLHSETIAIFQNLNSLINEFDKFNGDDYIYEFFLNLRNQVDLHREELINQIIIKSDELLLKLKQNEEKCKLNTARLDKISFNETKGKMMEYKQKLRNPIINKDELNDLMVQLKEHSKSISKKIRKYELDLILNEFIVFKKSNDLSFGNIIQNHDHITLSKNCGQLVKSFHGHTEKVTSIQIIKNSNKFLSASKDKTIKIWNIESGECMKTLKGHELGVLAILVASDSKLISSSLDQTIKIWDLSNFECTNTLKVESKVNCLVNVSENEFAGGSDDGRIIIWNSLQKIKYIEAHESSVFSCQVTNDNLKLISSSNLDKKIKVWNLKTLRLIKEIVSDSESFFSLISNNYKLLDCTRKFYKSSLIKLWNMNTGQCLKQIDLSYDVYCIKQLDKEVFAFGSEEKIIIYDIKTDKLLRSLPVRTHKSFEKVKNIELSSNGNILAAYDCSIQLWNMIDNNLI